MNIKDIIDALPCVPSNIYQYCVPIYSLWGLRS